MSWNEVYAYVKRLPGSHAMLKSYRVVRVGHADIQWKASKQVFSGFAYSNHIVMSLSDMHSQQATQVMHTCESTGRKVRTHVQSAVCTCNQTVVFLSALW